MPKFHEGQLIWLVLGSWVGVPFSWPLVVTVGEVRGEFVRVECPEPAAHALLVKEYGDLDDQVWLGQRCFHADQASAEDDYAEKLGKGWVSATKRVTQLNAEINLIGDELSRMARLRAKRVVKVEEDDYADFVVS